MPIVHDLDYRGIPSLALTASDCPRTLDSFMLRLARRGAKPGQCKKRRAAGDGRFSTSSVDRDDNASARRDGRRPLQELIDHGRLDDARQAFEALPFKTVVAYTALLGAYARRGQAEEAVGLYRRMHLDGARPNRVTFVEVLGCCGSLDLGRRLGASIGERPEYSSHPVVCTALLCMYGRCGDLVAARQAFDAAVCRDVVLWNAMVLVYNRAGYHRDAARLFKSMQLDGVRPNVVSFLTVLPALSANLREGRMLHSLAAQSGSCCLKVENALLSMYGKCGATADAQQTFSSMAEHDVVSWNALISAYAVQRTVWVVLFHQMLLHGFRPDTVTFLSVLGACTTHRALKCGRLVHACVMETDDLETTLATALVTMFSRCGSLHRAREVFLRARNQHTDDVVLWNSVIAANAQHQDFEAAVEYYHGLLLHGLSPDSFTFVSTINAVAPLEKLSLGRSLHSHVVEQGLESDVVVSTALVNMYSKCRCLDRARAVFNRLPSPDLIAWNVLLGAYVEQGKSELALELFCQMNIPADEVTFINVLGACANSSFLPQGRRIHAAVVDRGLDSDVIVGTAVLDMYGKCGSLGEAYQAFNSIVGRNIITWNSIITAYAQHGGWDDVVPLARQMQQEGVEPNDVTFIGILSACSHAGLLEDGCHYFAAMTTQYCIQPRTEHYGCLIDLLGRVGRLDDAEEYLKSLPSIPVTWSALLAACKVHGDVERARRAARRVIELEPSNVAAYLVLSNSMTSG